ncbi:YcdB/YcdC domain-containing protein [Clostridium sp. CMCC3677]|uniref:YcdB/YcdC domain-containing protein n=1 Tax=Clostridium sp. CMCC3677 TaxID=2949963 RepID=UPI0013F12AD0|nr:YcdB/YcdC domain-containing protein [Clostridium sp. CMCC3677]NFG61391.1 peptidase M4 [Clostridium botulinum]NFQ10373.1 peptidase M4 [Clostridium botulinum]
MKKNYFFSILLLFCLLFSLQYPAFADENYSKSLENAITKTKNIITIPDTYTDFTHSSREQKTILGQVNLFEFNWSEVQGKYGNISISIDENGNIYDFYKYSNENTSKSLASVTKDESRQACEDFIKKALVNHYSSLKEINVYNDPTDSSYTFKYKCYFNNIPLNFLYVNISVDKYTGEIITFNTNNLNTNSLSYPSNDNIVEKSKAKKSYVDKIGLKLNYYSYYDYKNDKLNIFPAYCINSTHNVAIDAHSGEKISINNENIYLGKDGYKNTNESLDSLKNLTKEEDDAIKNVSGLINKDTATDIIKKYSDLDSFEGKISNSHINKDLISNNYIWTINFENASAEVDAKSSELLSFYHYSNIDDKNNVIPIDDAKNIANKFLNEVSPNKFIETKLEVLDTNINENDSFYNFKFIRQANGINFVNNYLMVSINKFSGKVCEYNSQWYDNVNFPDIKSALSSEAIFDKISDKFGLEYTMSNDNNISLIYNFIDLDENYLVNPFNGTRIKFNGEVYKENELPKYSDINGHWCEKIVKELLENGYYLKSDNFNPDNNITQINFLKYLYSQIWNFNNSDDDDKFYDMLIEKGILKTEEKSPDSLLTNKDISKLIVRYLGYDKIAKNAYIFNNPFSDSIEDDIKGYSSICHSLGIITGDENNNFNPNNNVTNAEAAKIIYNLLTKANNK